MQTFTYKNATYGETDGRVFDSLADMVAACQAIPAERSIHGSCNIDSAKFVGRRFRDADDALAALQTAWSDGIEIVERMGRELDGANLPKPTSRRRKMRFSESDGDEVDYDRLRCGQDCWRTTRRQSTSGPATITVVVDVCANARVKHSDILWRGAAAVALTKRLEEAGYRVELWAVALSVENYYKVSGFNAVCLKRPGDPLDESSLINAVSGWGFRSLWFLASCFGSLEINPSLGKARAPTSDELDRITPDAKRVLIADAWTYSEAVSLIRQTIHRITTNATSK